MNQRLRRALADDCGWKKHNFESKKIVDGEEKEPISHEIDHGKRFKAGTFALESEWNNKDPFFDRGFKNFKRLHADGVISIGAIMARGVTLQESLRDLIAQFAGKSGINGKGALSKHYTPALRQIEIIDCAVRSKGSFKKG